MSTADDWYDAWLADLCRRARRTEVRKRLTLELRGVQHDVATSPERAFDEQTEQLRRTLQHSRVSAA